MTQPTQKTTLHIKGTHCASCKALIEEIGRETKGIVDINMDYETGTVVIEHEADVDWVGFKSEIEKIGPYQVEMPETK